MPHALFFEVDNETIALGATVTNLHGFTPQIDGAFVLLVVDRKDIDLADFSIDFDKKYLVGKLIIIEVTNATVIEIEAV